MKELPHKINVYILEIYIGKNYNIKHRDEDGFINVTDLCKAGEKSFKAWETSSKNYSLS
jgi:hypothetical protein